MLAAILFALALTPAFQAPSQDVLAEVRIQGNVLTPDEEVRRLAGVELGMHVMSDTAADVATRLRATRRFERVEVLKRFASISDPTQIVLVIIVDEGPVRITEGGSPGAPARVERDRSFRLMFLPILKFEDGYGVSYGARVSRRAPLGRRSGLSFPLTWGGEKRAAAELNKDFVRGPVSRIEAGAAVSRRLHPFYEQQDDRQRVWLTATRDLPWSLRASGSLGWEHVAFLDRHDGMLETGADVVLDTRLDPVLARNAIYARMAWDRSNVPGGAVDQTVLDARGYIGLPGQSILVVRGVREDADRTLPPYLKSMLGGMPNLRGFRRGTAVGDTLVASGIELRVPLTSPLRIGKVGVSALVDAAKTYDKGQRFGDRRFERGVGGAVWFSVAFLRLNVAVAHGIGGSTRLHVGTTIW